jgi:hypothetical protein
MFGPLSILAAWTRVGRASAPRAPVKVRQRHVGSTVRTMHEHEHGEQHFGAAAEGCTNSIPPVTRPP